MKYIDSSVRSAEETVGFWMQAAVASGIKEIRCQSGYFTVDGLSVLLPALKKCAAGGATIRLLVGSNLGVTLASHVSFIAGALAVPQTNIAIGIVSFEGSLFHPKAYHFVREDGSQTAYVGSANLTGPGVEGLNVEAGIILDTRDSDSVETLQKISERVDAWFAHKFPGLSVVNQLADIDALLAGGYLALKAIRTTQAESAGEGAEKTKPARPRLKSVFDLPEVEFALTTTGTRQTKSLVEIRRSFTRTEASFHYPQGTHPGHLLAILYYFSGDRAGTAFDNEYIRLNGSLGEGRLAAFRRQIKYKLLAAIELGLITDIRLARDPAAYTPELTQRGAHLWSLFEPFVDEADLVLEVEDGGLSSKMPRSVAFYNDLIRSAQHESEELKELLLSTVLNMPAANQLLQLFYYQERTPRVSKARIYETFFEFGPVAAFCDAMGIEPATHEGAKHRCPFLINLLDACGIVTQSSAEVTVQKLALSPNMLSRDGNEVLGGGRLEIIASNWPAAADHLPNADVVELRDLFGVSFLTDGYYLTQLVRIPDGQ